MDRLLAMFASGQAEFGKRVHAVTEYQWASATPDTEWSVADLVNHLIDEHRWVPPLLRGLDLRSAGEVVDGSRSLPVDGGVGANLAQEWDETAVASANAVRAPGTLERTVELSRGQTPVRGYLEELVFDLTVHAWDLGTAIGYAEPLPDELVGYVYERVSGHGDLSGSGLFGKPVDVPDDAPTIDKLVAATGRRPREGSARAAPLLCALWLMLPSCDW
jgi:uncharacterized protein (TIGR03086 family)